MSQNKQNNQKFSISNEIISAYNRWKFALKGTRRKNHAFYIFSSLCEDAGLDYLKVVQRLP